jgi:hypothetical protein
VELVLGVVAFEAIFEDQFRFLCGGAQFRMSSDVGQCQGIIGHALERVLQFIDALYDLGRGSLRLDVGIECDFTFDFFNVFGDGGFAVDARMDTTRDDACQWIGVRHGWIISPKCCVAKVVETQLQPFNRQKLQNPHP